jgi:hypothetical protein
MDVKTALQKTYGSSKTTNAAANHSNFNIVMRHHRLVNSAF